MDPVLLQTRFTGRPIGELMLQIQFNHEDDTDDIPEGQDPVLIQTQDIHVRPIGELMKNIE